MAIGDKRLSNQPVKVADEVYIDQSLRVGGILFLEEMLDKSFDQIADDIQKAMAGNDKVSAMIREVKPFLLALMHQRHPDLSIDEMSAILDNLKLEEFTALFDNIRIFADTPGKNSGGPTAKTKRRRQPVTRKK
jgi:hypothetical protein